MKKAPKGTILLGVANKRYFLASVAAHHYVVKGKLMADGGQPNTGGYAGYSRFSGNSVWAMVPETYAEVVTKYNAIKETGIWAMNQVKILDAPDTTTLAWVREHAIWGTRGKNGDQPLKYVRLDETESNHLEAILSTQKGISPRYKIIIEAILGERYKSRFDIPAELLDL